jgi:ABC transport system ATP-binding/permease protein
MLQIDTKETIRFPLDGTTITLGRDPSCTVPLEGMGISRRHAAIELVSASCTITDQQSSFGLRVNGLPVERHVLADNDVITIGVREFKVGLSGSDLLLTPFSEPGGSTLAVSPSDANKKVISIGRDVGADVALVHPLVSRRHASVERTPGGNFFLTDHGSANGTFVNGKSITHCVIDEGDIIQVGPYRLFIEHGRIIRADDGNRIRLEAFDVSVRTRHAVLLDHVTITVPAGEFVAVLGMSGAGKSTLVRALCGRQRIDGGVIYANRLPLKQFLSAFTANIGYVAQENLLHAKLTVAETFAEQCLIRLPRDSTPLERKARIDEVVGLLDLDRVAHRQVNRLSGGEAKRVHLGVELLASPALIVLDEPLAGLDPGLVRKFMQLFRRICDRGYTLLMTTHTLEQIEFCDRLVFMHRGRVVFGGQPSELESAFGTRTLADVYEKVASGVVPSVPAPVQAEAQHPAAPVAPSRLRRPRSISFVKQCVMLVARYAKILRRDRRNLALLLLQAPIIALFLGFVFKSDARFLPLSFFFCVTISAIWISGVNAAQEIAGEWLLLDRESRVGLSPGAFLCAKTAVTVLSALAQALFFWASLGTMFRTFPLTPDTLLLVAAGTVSGGVLGLCISACSGTVGRAITVLPIIFIPQIFFSGILIPFDRMTGMGSALSYCTFSRPVFSLFKHTCLLEQPVFQSGSWYSLCFLNLGLIILMALAVRWRLSRIHSTR